MLACAGSYRLIMLFILQNERNLGCHEEPAVKPES